MRIKLIAECRELNNRISLGASLVNDIYYYETYIVINFLFWRLRFGILWGD